MWHLTAKATNLSPSFIELEFGVLIFVEGGKPENPEKNPRSKDENQQQTGCQEPTTNCHIYVTSIIYYVFAYDRHI